MICHSKTIFREEEPLSLCFPLLISSSLTTEQPDKGILALTFDPSPKWTTQLTLDP